MIRICPHSDNMCPHGIGCTFSCATNSYNGEKLAMTNSSPALVEREAISSTLQTVVDLSLFYAPNSITTLVIDKAVVPDFVREMTDAILSLIQSREGQGSAQSKPCGAREPISRAAPEGDEFLEFKEALSDLRALRQEHADLNGGGPGWAARNRAAWARVDELFANEDEAAYDRQQEDFYG